MNLALLSHQDTPAAREAIKRMIKALGQSNLTAAYIASEPDPERAFFRETQSIYRSLGVELDTYIDFESGFSYSLFEEVLQKPLIHLSGGNTFRFLQALKARKLEKTLTQYAENGGTFIGVSAGAMLLTPNIESATICGDKNEVELSDFSALNLVDFMFSPHATKEGHELEEAKQLVAKNGKSMYLCTDDEGLLQLNSSVSIIGKPAHLKA